MVLHMSGHLKVRAVDGERGFCKSQLKATRRGGAALLSGREPLSRRQLPGPAPALTLWLVLTWVPLALVSSLVSR